MVNRRSILAFILGAILFAGVSMVAAPIGTTLRSVLPETTGRYNLGTTSPSALLWQNIWTQNLNVGTTTDNTGFRVQGPGLITDLTTGNFKATGTTLMLTGYNCTGSNGGALTVGSDGVLVCSDDDGGGAGSLSGSGGTNMPAYWTNATTLAATSSPTFASLYATSTTATNSIAGNLNIGGNVGIGITSPNYPLHISNTAAQVGINDPNGTAAYTTYLGNGTAAGQVGFGGIAGAFNSNDMVLRSNTSGRRLNLYSMDSLRFFVNGSNTAVGIIDTGGNVGIGTTSPGSILSVKGPFLANSTSTIEGGGLVTQAIAATGTLGFYTAGAAAPRMVVDASGNVGIGTAGPGVALDIGSGQFRVPAGTAAAPAIVSQGLTNEGFYFTSDAVNYASGGTQRWQFTSAILDIYSATGQIRLGTGADVGIARSNDTVSGLALRAGSAERVRIADGGNVGIGQTNPKALLTVGNAIGTGDAIFGGDLFIYGGDINLGTGSATTTISGNGTGIGIGTSSPGALLALNGPALFGNGTTTALSGLITPSIAATSSLGFYTTNAAAPRMYINSAGNVGIGTAAPRSALDVVTNTVASYPLTLQNTYSGGNNIIEFMNTAGTLQGMWGLSNSTGGIVTGAVANDMAFRTQGGNLLFSTDSGTTAQMYLKNGGNVGIGTTSPGAMLSVHGPALFGNGTTTALSGLITPSIYATSTLGIYSGSHTKPVATVHPNNAVGVGTSTPGATLAVKGDALVEGTVTTGNITSTSTATFNNVVVNGTCTGCGGSSATSSPWVSLGDTEATAATSSITVANFSNYKLLRFTVWISGKAIGGSPAIRFNADSAGNYDYALTEDAVSAKASAAAYALLESTGNIQNKLFECTVSNNQGIEKTGGCYGYAGATDTAAGVQSSTGFDWNNTTAYINEIRLINSGGQNLNAGSRLTVEGR